MSRHGPTSISPRAPWPSIVSRPRAWGSSSAIRAEQVLATPRFNGNLKVGAFSPRNLMLELGIGPPVTANPKVLTQLSGDVSFAGSTSGVNLDPLDLRLDDTALQGSLGVPDLKKQAPRFKLVVNAVDLDRYLPPKAAGEGVNAATPGAAAGAAAKLPVNMLRALDVEGSLGWGNSRRPISSSRTSSSTSMPATATSA